MIPTLTDIRNIEWGKSYLWALNFPPYETQSMYSPPDPPSMFSSWFPAQNVTEPVFSIENYSINSPIVNFQIPKSFSFADINILFYDTNTHAIREWVYSWFLYMFGLSHQSLYTYKKFFTSKRFVGVRPLMDVIRPVNIIKYTSDHIVISDRTYYIFPSSNFAANLNSESQALTDKFTFTVVGGMVTGTKFNI
jgi:hypothetical protein